LAANVYSTVANPKALLFDFGGTLDLPGSHWLDRFLSNYRRAGITISRKQLDDAFAHATASAYRAGAAMRERELVETVGFLIDSQLAYLSSQGSDGVRAQLGQAASAQRGLGDRISAGFIEETMRGLAASRELLAQWSRDFRLGVISNFYGNLDRVLEQARMRDLFEVVIDSVLVDVFKPDPRIYQIALDAFALSAEQVAMVGDSLAKDCIPARRLGMRTAWLVPANHAVVHEEAEAAEYMIRELRELAEIKW